MNNNTILKAHLAQHAIAVIPDLFDKIIIERWNLLLDPIINAQAAARKYVSALELSETGILNEIFSDNLLSIIFSLIPDAELYHCHAYEIAANQKKSHIKSNNKLHGWHRDNDCKHNFSKDYIQHLSLFIYLTDVSEIGGYFEVSDKQLRIPPIFGNSDICYQLIGKTGHSFLFDRKAFHRASPNYSDIPRRVLKISFQSSTLFNHKRAEIIFEQVRSQLANDQIILRQLFGDKSVQGKLETTQVINQLKGQGVTAKLPAYNKPSQFSLNENIKRYVRDFRFVIHRLAVQYFKVNDKKVPQPKITIKPSNGKSNAHQ